MVQVKSHGIVVNVQVQVQVQVHKTTLIGSGSGGGGGGGGGCPAPQGRLVEEEGEGVQVLASMVDPVHPTRWKLRPDRVEGGQGPRTPPGRSPNLSYRPPASTDILQKAFFFRLF